MGDTESDSQRFEALYRSTYRDLVSYCRRRVPAHAVDDVVAATYMVAWRRLDDVLAAKHPPAWLYGVAYKVIGNQRRGRNRLSALRIKLLNQPRESIPGPASLVELDEDVTRALTALSRLPPDDQEIIRLATFEGLQYEEIAEALGKSLGAVRSQLFRARQRLRTEYQKVPRPGPSD